MERCLQENSGRLSGLTVLARADASTTVRYVNGGLGSSEFLSKVMRRIWDICVVAGIGLVAEHLPGPAMIETGVDSLSRAAEFTVCWPVFRKFKGSLGFGRRGSISRYTLDLYASKKTKKCSRYAAKGAPAGSLGDARTLELGSDENVWACPPPYNSGVGGDAVVGSRDKSYFSSAGLAESALACLVTEQSV